MTPARTAYRDQVRGAALEAASDLVLAHGWDRVRVGEVARRVGVSRPTLYAEFGDKQGLGEALLLQETDRFLAGVAELVADEPDPARAVLAAVRHVLEEAERNPLLHAVLTSTRVDEAGLVPLLARSVPLLRRAVDAMTAGLAPRLPGVDPAELEEAVEAGVRLVVSHLVQPAGDPAATARRLARVVWRYLGLAEPVVSPG